MAESWWIMIAQEKAPNAGDDRRIRSTSTGTKHQPENRMERLSSPASATQPVGGYILLKYLDPPWQGFYDIFKVINQDLLIGRVYLGEYPNGARQFTFPMTRKHSFDQMTVDDHAALYAAGSVPTAQDLQGVWRMDVISNANHATGAAYLSFELKPDGSFESRYLLMGLMEGLVMPSFLKDHFQLNDFTPFHDEIRKVTSDFLVGKYVTAIPAATAALTNNLSLGIFHSDSAGQFGFYYMLTKTDKKALPTESLLRPFLDVDLPDGLTMTFSEEMVGWYFEGATTPTPDRAGDLTIANLIPKTGTPAGGVDCKFDVHMTARDINEFIDGPEHEAEMQGTIYFRQILGRKPGELCGRLTEQPVQLPGGQPRDGRSRNEVSPRVFHSGWQAFLP